ncbi:MAG: hypothetical protein PUI54_05190 [Bacteroidales bacterium]|nr:hypothetical protein [Bacteroidales bacterium]
MTIQTGLLGKPRSLQLLGQITASCKHGRGAGNGGEGNLDGNGMAYS